MTPPVISPTGGWIGTIIFVLLFLAALILFGLRVGELITLLAKARREDRTDHIDDRIGEFFLVVLGQSGVLRDPIPGIAHFFTFWGFIVIQFGLLNLILGAFNGTLPLLGDNHAFAIVLEHAAIGEMARVFHQDVAHVFRAEEQDSWILSDVDGCHVAIGALQLLQKSKWVLPQWEKMANIG